MQGEVDDLFSEPILKVEESNIIVEAIKPMEWDEENGSAMDYAVLRIYECQIGLKHFVLIFPQKP